MREHLTDEATRQLLDRFVNAVTAELPLVSVWAHGSLAGGDYQPGRSDLDLIAVLDQPCTTPMEQRLEELHTKLCSALPLASKLHCSYLAATELADPARTHVRWAQEELMRRPVTPVTRRELHDFGLALHGQPPAALVPLVTDGQLTDFVLDDLQNFWRPSLEHPEWYARDVWVDLGLLTLARAKVTLQDGKLITKAQALHALTQMGAPPKVLDDIRQRRYGHPGTISVQWATRRAELTLAYLKPAIEQILTSRRPNHGTTMTI